ncbi:MAG: DsbA family protein [Janthinobacterium lividum]
MLKYSPLLALAAGLAIVGTPAAQAQFAGTPDPSSFRDTSMLKPPAGQKVAIIEFYDLECPACRNAHPILQQVSAQTHVPIVHYDFPLSMHVWSKDAAVFARYLQDKVNPKLAEDYRTDVFKQQPALASKDDLQQYTRKWMTQHGQAMPFVVDPGGKFAAEVHADYALGERLNVTRTPTIIVATANKWQIVSGSEGTGPGVNDVNRVFAIVSAAEKQAGSTASAGPRPVSRR